MAKNLLDKLIFSVVDLETTGLSAEKDEIVEVCVVRVIGGKIKEHWDTLVQPNNPVRLKITRIHGITNDMLMTAPEKYEVLPMLRKKLIDTVLVEHNKGGFDNRFLTKFIGEKIWKHEVNTIKMAKILNPKLGSYNLKRLSQHYGVKFFKHHQALNDAMTTAKIFIKMLNLLWENKAKLESFMFKHKIYQEVLL